METMWLEDFLAVVEESGFSRAAIRRAVSQPAFSRRIRSLEQWVGTSLFDRSTHSVCLTAAGERFLPVAEEVLRRIQIGREEAMNASKAARTTLRFASTHVLSLTFFPKWLRTLEAATLSSATVQLTADNMASCERLMIEGRAQFLLCHHHPAAPSRLTEAFRSIKLGVDVLLPVAAPGEDDGAPIAERPYLAYTAESGMGRILDAAWSSSGRPIPDQPVFSSHLASALAAMARDGRGVSWSPLSLVGDDLESGRLVRLGDRDNEVPIEIHLFRPKARQSPAAEALWERIVKFAAETPFDDAMGREGAPPGPSPVTA